MLVGPWVIHSDLAKVLLLGMVFFSSSDRESLSSTVPKNTASQEWGDTFSIHGPAPPHKIAHNP